MKWQFHKSEALENHHKIGFSQKFEYYWISLVLYKYNWKSIHNQFSLRLSAEVLNLNLHISEKFCNFSLTFHNWMMNSAIPLETKYTKFINIDSNSCGKSSFQCTNFWLYVIQSLLGLARIQLGYTTRGE